MWYKNGNPRIWKKYRQGSPNGEHREWNENGTLWMHMFYRDQEIVDSNFTKRKAFLRAIRHFRQIKINLLNFTIISDLGKIISQFQ